MRIPTCPQPRVPLVVIISSHPPPTEVRGGYTGHHCTVMVQADIADDKNVTRMVRNTFIGKEIDG